MYADYTFYSDEYRGYKLDGDSFPRLAQRASDYLDYITLGKAQGAADDTRLKKACCAIAEAFDEIEKAESSSKDGGEIASEHVGGHSVTYRSSAEYIVGVQKRLKEAARMYLGGTGLLYRGIPSCTPRIP